MIHSAPVEELSGPLASEDAILYIYKVIFCQILFLQDLALAVFNLPRQSCIHEERKLSIELALY